LSVKSLAIPDIKVISFARFKDDRGYFTEPYRKSDLLKAVGEKVLPEILQTNESFSRKGVIRGLHFQWNPYMGKLVRTLRGRMIDIVLDIRKGSPTFGKAIAYDMPFSLESDHSEWIWVPPGFAHGNLFAEETSIEYFCSGEYSQGCEAGISPFAPDLDWSLCDAEAKKVIDGFHNSGELIISAKDKLGNTLASWSAKPESDNFIAGRMN